MDGSLAQIDRSFNPPAGLMKKPTNPAGNFSTKFEIPSQFKNKIEILYLA
jgi:hypothetical protein